MREKWTDVLAYVALGLINAGMKRCEAALKPLLFAGRGGDFYLDATASTLSPIGTLTRTADGTSKKRSSAGDGATRPVDIRADARAGGAGPRGPYPRSSGPPRGAAHAASFEVEIGDRRSAAQASKAVSA